MEGVFLDPIPPGLAPELQIWHVAKKERREMKGNSIISCQREGDEAVTQIRGEHLSVIMLSPSDLRLFLLIGFD